MSLIGKAALIKGAPAIIAASVIPHDAAAEQLIDPKAAAVILIGLVFGAIARSGYLYNARQAWDDIRRDIVVSMLIGGLNFTIVIYLTGELGLTHLQALIVACVLAAGGARASWDFMNFLWTRIFQARVEQHAQELLERQRRESDAQDGSEDEDRV